LDNPYLDLWQIANPQHAVLVKTAFNDRTPFAKGYLVKQHQSQTSRSCRKETATGKICLGNQLTLKHFGSTFDRLTDAHVGGAAADVTCHRVINALVGGVRDFAQQYRGAYHLTGLAPAALRYVDLFQRGLDGFRLWPFDGFYCGH
jgi:hypothetical protein